MTLRRALAVAIGFVCTTAPVVNSFAQETVTATTLTAATSTSEEYLNPLHQEEWVTLDADGNISGAFKQLVSVESVGRQPIKIALMQNGQALYSSESDTEGKFRFQKIQPGTYALVARSDHSMAVYALHVLPAEASKQLDSNIVVYGTSAPAAMIDQILRSDLIPETSTIYPVLERDPIGEARRFNTESKVQLRGTELVGRISRASGLAHYDLTGNSVRVLQDGKTVGQTLTNSKGEFSIANMAAGTYDLIVAGKDGMAVGSFQAIAGSGIAANGSGSAKLVTTAAQSDCPSCLNVEVASCNECWAPSAPVVESAPIVENFVDPGMAPIPGGGFVGPGGFPGGGGFAGGGAGGGGLGGAGGALGGGRLPLGALLGIGGLAAGVAALAANDDGFNAVPASVIVP